MKSTFSVLFFVKKDKCLFINQFKCHIYIFFVLLNMFTSELTRFN